MSAPQTTRPYDQGAPPEFGEWVRVGDERRADVPKRPRRWAVGAIALALLLALAYLGYRAHRLPAHHPIPVRRVLPKRQGHPPRLPVVIKAVTRPENS